MEATVGLSEEGLTVLEPCFLTSISLHAFRKCELFIKKFKDKYTVHILLGLDLSLRNSNSKETYFSLCGI